MKSDGEPVRMSSKMMSLWQRAIKSGRASVLDELDVSPDELLLRVEEFESTSQATEHSYPAMIYSNRESSSTSRSQLQEYDSEEDEDYSEDDSFDAVESTIPLGSLPIDSFAKQFIDGEDEN